MEIAGLLLLFSLILRVIKRFIIPLLFGIFVLYVIGYLQEIQSVEINRTGNVIFDYFNNLPNQVYVALKDIIQPLIEALIQFVHSVKKEILRWN
ncbi:hypothetical protein NHG29_03025 [Aerococcaceae bacterium NML160702]|nr:hypothetical protein [Aerococcaceae bacterium NML160702]